MNTDNGNKVEYDDSGELSGERQTKVNIVLCMFGIVCYGLMIWICIECLLSVIKWHWLLIFIYAILAWSAFVVVMSTIILFKHLKLRYHEQRR